MPIDDDIKEHYPDDWDEIRERVLERATLDKEWIVEPIPCCEILPQARGEVAS